jgi:2-(1,2-epoxy-1,2-dihydrophenyl)acetyl-CoA isomerase
MSVTSSDLDNGIRLIRFSGHSATQSFSRKFLPQIAQAIDAGLIHPNVRAIVLTGEGKFFSAGADIHAFAQSIEDEDAPQLIRDLTGILHPLLIRMRQSSTICIAAVNGACAGGGLGLALACDARIASTKAKMAASYSGMGLSPDGGTTWLLPRLVGDQISRRFFFENEKNRFSESENPPEGGDNNNNNNNDDDDECRQRGTNCTYWKTITNI